MTGRSWERAEMTGIRRDSSRRLRTGSQPESGRVVVGSVWCAAAFSLTLRQVKILI